MEQRLKWAHRLRIVDSVLIIAAISIAVYAIVSSSWSLLPHVGVLLLIGVGNLSMNSYTLRAAQTSTPDEASRPDDGGRP